MAFSDNILDEYYPKLLENLFREYIERLSLDRPHFPTYFLLDLICIIVDGSNLKYVYTSIDSEMFIMHYTV